MLYKHARDLSPHFGQRDPSLFEQTGGDATSLTKQTHQKVLRPEIVMA